MAGQKPVPMRWENLDAEDFDLEGLIPAEPSPELEGVVLPAEPEVGDGDDLVPILQVSEGVASSGLASRLVPAAALVILALGVVAWVRLVPERRPTEVAERVAPLSVERLAGPKVVAPKADAAAPAQPAAKEAPKADPGVAARAIAPPAVPVPASPAPAAKQVVDDIAREAERKKAEVAELEKIKKDTAEDLKKNPPAPQPMFRGRGPAIPPEELRKIIEQQRKMHEEMVNRMMGRQRDFQRNAARGFDDLFDQMEKQFQRDVEQMNKMMQQGPNMPWPPVGVGPNGLGNGAGDGANPPVIRRFNTPNGAGVIIRWRGGMMGGN